MALLDVGLVTETLVRLLEEHISRSPAWPSTVTVTATPEPPDKLEGDNVVGLYLYRVTEVPGYKNAPPPGSGDVPVRYTPMALDLHYLLTAHSDTDGPAGTYREQLIMSCAMKALHDYPVVDETTQIDGVTVMPASLIGQRNCFRVSLDPVPQEQAADYWGAGGMNVRLAAYYTVSVALLEPEPPPQLPGRVLTYGVHAFTMGAPRLTGSRSLVTFRLPGATADTTIEARPAQASPGETVTFLGSSLAGDGLDLLIRGAGWPGAEEAGVAWSVAYAPTPREEAVTAVVQTTVGGRDVLPGVYAASVRVTRQRTLPGGTVRDIEHTSNETPFVVSPRLDPIPDPGVSGVTQVTGFIFQHADLDPEDVRVYVGAERLTPGAAGALLPGQFDIVDGATIEIRLPSGLSSGDEVPVRVLVNQAESAPQWVLVP